MTKKDLSQLYYINREIEQDKKRLAELEDSAISTRQIITGIPHGINISDKTGKYAVEMADLKRLIDFNIQKCLRELIRLNKYIYSINDSEIRQIFTLRYINGLSWEQVASKISVYATEDSVRKAHDRYLNKSKLCPIRPSDM